MSRVKSVASDDLFKLIKDHGDRKRDLSPYVVPRLYRAPEIILMQQHYDCAVDIWSVGCILAELMALSLPYVDDFKAMS